MESSNKRRMSPSPPPLGQDKPKRHRSRLVEETPAPAPQSQAPTLQPFIERRPRPSRWRKSKPQAEPDLPLLQTIYESETDDASTDKHKILKRPEKKTELRFSFTQPVDEERLKSKPGVQTHCNQRSASKISQSDKPLLSSFSDLSVERSKKGAVQKVQAITTEQPIISGLPNLGQMTKRREGYGFSFTDSLFCDSEDYPATECDWGSETEKAPSPPPEQFPVLGSVGTTNIAPNSSFDDFVVVRDVGSFHLAKPQRRLSCTNATQEDTIRIKYAAKSLLKYNESSNIHAEILSRLERMVHRSVQKSAGGRTEAASALQCALKLQDFLIRTKGGRVDTGEVVRVVEHEIEWATWLVEASRTGVIHIKGPGCKCRPEWEEE